MELQRVGHDWAPFTFTQSMGFPGSSAGKESTCNAGDPSSISGLGRPPGERIGYPLQYSWASLVAETVKNPPAMWKTWVQSLGWEDPLEEGLATHSSILAWRIPWTEGPGGLQSVQSQNVRHDWVTKHSTAHTKHRGRGSSDFWGHWNTILYKGGIIVKSKMRPRRQHNCCLPKEAASQER